MKDITKFDRVSAVLAPFSGLHKIDPNVLALAAARGSCVHKLIDAHIGGFGLHTIDSLVSNYCEDLFPGEGIEELIEKEKEKVRLMFQSFEKWAEGKQFIPKPDRFFCDKLMITGELDQIWKDVHDRHVLIDFKTSYNESKTWLLQGSAYCYLAELNGYTIDYIEFVQLSKTGGVPRCYHYQKEFPMFKAHLDVYRYSYKDGKFPDLLDFL